MFLITPLPKPNDPRLILSVTPSVKILAAEKRFEGECRWVSKSELSVRDTPANRSLAESLGGTLRPVVQGTGLAPDPRPPYRPKTEPFPHQADAFRKADGKPAFALFMEQGTGKTKVALDLAGASFARGEISAVLIVAPKGVHRQWIDSQTPTHLGTPWKASFWPETTPTTSIVEPRKLLLFAINVDALRSKRGMHACTKFIDAHNGRVLLIVDESHIVKNNRSIRWKSVKALASLCGRRLLLTGTPIAKNLVDVWSQFQILDERIIGIKYITHFRNEFCIMGGYEGREIIGAKSLDEFQRRVEPFSFRASKEAIGILPKAYSRWNFDLSSHQRDLMRKMKKELIAKIDSGEITTAANAAVAMIRLQQIASGFIYDDATSKAIALEYNPRLDALAEYVDALEGQAIIWARFRFDIKSIEMLLGGDCVTYYGGTSSDDRNVAVESFLQRRARFFVSNTQSGGVGLNLQGHCTNAVYYSHDDNYINRVQSEDRIHRIGTTGACVFTDLIGAGSTDARMRRNFANKQSFADLALGDIRKVLTDEDDAG